MKTRSVVVALFAISALFAYASPAGAAKNLYLAAGDNPTGALELSFSLGNEGLPAPLQTFSGSPSGYFNAITMSPDGKFVFMADYQDDQFRSLTVGPDGKLTDAPGSPLTVPDSGPYGSAVTPDGKYVIFGLYDAHSVQAFAIGADGSLTPAPGGAVEIAPTALPYGVAVSIDSRTLYVPDYETDSLYTYRIGSDGVLTELPGSPLASGTSIYQPAVTPDGRYLYFPDTDNDQVYGYSLAADGMPTALPGSPFPVMSNLFGGFTVSPDGKTLYGTGDEKVQSALIAADGSLTAGPSVTAVDYTPGLALDPSGTRLYNVVDTNTTANPLVTYSVGEAGALAPIGSPLIIEGEISPDSDTMVVSPAQPPVAKLTTKTGRAGTVTFDASGSTDPDGAIASYAWDFGDGNKATTTTPTTSHTYAKSGDYLVSLTLTDADNCSTESVFNGRSVYCDGSATAKTEATAKAAVEVTGVKVTAKKVQKQKGKKLVIKVKAGASESVSLQASGSATFKKTKGKVSLKQTKGQAAAGQLKVLKLGSKSTRKIGAAIRKKGKATIKVKLTDALGNSVARTIKVNLAPAKRR